ncbi:MAG: hypothetical protein OHK0052_11270 [Anaerolineales bacterium]
MNTHLDFDVRFEKDADGKVRARVLNSPQGQDSAPLETLPAPLSEDSEDATALRTYGIALFEAVFHDNLLALWRGSLTVADQQNARLRLLLRFTDAPELAALGWEYLCDPVSQTFLALDGRTPVVRYLEVAQQPRPLATALPLHILSIIASPSDYPPLEAENEWQTLQTILQPLEQRGLIQLHRLQPATVQNLQQKLRNETFHILHFIGHGGFDETQGGYLLFEQDGSTYGQAIGAQHFANLLTEERQSLGLIALNACQSAQASLHKPFSGLAQSLVKLGIPAIVANHRPIPDQAAQVFSAELYRTLAEGRPIEHALAEGRKAIYNRGFVHAWATPALFLRTASDGRLFNLALDLPRLAEALKQVLPPNDPAPQNLLQGMQSFQQMHTHLYEWKELHNFVNDILYVLAQFTREVERIELNEETPNARALRRLWRPIAQKVDLMLDWAAQVRFIADIPFARLPSGALQGPDWAIALETARQRLDELLEINQLEIDELTDAAFDFNDAAERHMYLADKRLRETAGELFNLSRTVLGSFGNANPIP